MGTIIDYLHEYGEYSFEEKSFSDTDALVLCQFCYLKFDGLIPGMKENPVTLQELNQSRDRELLFADYRYAKDNKALMDGMLKGIRFQNLKICCYINRIDNEKETQFAAVTFLLPHQNVFIAFRGTDETIAGWQEDFSLALRKPVMGQMLSSKYINDVANRFGGKFMIGGHSKGGNLAMYSAMRCSQEIRDRIRKIYSFDGPGFRPEFLKEYDYDAIRDRVVRIIPKSSLVGMLLAVDENSIIVESKAFGVLQHNPYTWLVRDGHFVLADALDEGQHITDKAINEWVLALDEERLEKFVTLFNELLASSEATTTLEFAADRKHMLAMLKAYQGIDDETRKFIGLIIKSYFESYKRVVREMKKELSFGKGKTRESGENHQTH